MDKVEVKPFSQILGQAPTEGPKPFSSLLNKSPRNFSSLLSTAPQKEDPITLWERKQKEYEGKDFNRETILNDPELMSLVETNLSSRYKDRNMIYQGATAAAGGATAFGWEKMSQEEKLDTFLNYQRSFAGGQSVTTLNEIGYATNADDETKAKLAIGYELFDRIDNAIVGSGTWSNALDATVDYSRALIWDPTTLLGLGVGRAFSAAGSKGAATALRLGAKTAYKTALEAAKKEGLSSALATQAAREAGDAVMKQGFKAIGVDTTKEAAEAAARQVIIRNNMGRGMTKEAAEVAANKALASVATRGKLDIAKAALYKELGATTAVDTIASVGMDIAYQNTLLITGAQEEYSIPQTFVAAVGGMVAPSIIAARTAAGKSKLFSIDKVLSDDYVGKDYNAIMELMKSKTDLSALNGAMQTSVQAFLDNIDKGLTWTAAKGVARKAMDAEGKELTVSRARNDFFLKFIQGYVTEGGELVDGYAVALNKAGVKFVKRDRDDTHTHFFADAIEWMDPNLLKRYVDGYEAKTGVKLGIGNTPEEVANSLRLQVSDGATATRLGRVISDIIERADDSVARKKFLEEKGPAYGSWLLSVWKRLVTAHPATTGANVKGYTQIALLNSVSDLVQGTLEFSVGTFQKSVGNTQAGADLLRKGKGTLVSLARRGKSILDWNTTLEEAEALLDALGTDTKEKLFKHGIGEGATSQGALPDFRIPENKATKAVERFVGGTQSAALTQVQDEVTKLISFYQAYERQLERTYGKSYVEFMSQPDKYAQMASEEFQTEVVSKALDRALRETSSKAWIDKRGSSPALQVAHIVENISNSPFFGYAVPFGRFFNTSVALLGDFSMVNWGRHLVKKGLGKEREASEDDSWELFSKGMVGIVGVAALATTTGLEKLENGLAWNQEKRADGSISDGTFDFPESFFRIAAQIAAHGVKDKEVPASLMEEAALVYGANTFRATQEGVQAVWGMIQEFGGGKIEEGVTSGASIITNWLAGIASGMTRPLDPINQTAGVISGDMSQPDRRQGSEFYNEATRYIDNIFNLPKEETRNSPTRGPVAKTDLGTPFSGVRSSGEPTPSERVMASIGLAPWQAVRWEGDPEVKNRLDKLVGPVINGYTEMMLRKHKDFFNLPLEDRQYYFNTEVKLPAEKKAKELLGLGDERDKNLQLMNQISGEGKAKVSRVLDKLGYESLQDILKEEGATSKLETILYYLKNYEALEF